MDFLNDLGKRLSGAARSVQEKAKEGAELGRLSNEARVINGELEKLYGSLGRAYYDAQKNGAEDLSALNAFVEKIDAALVRMDEIRQQRDRLRQQRRCPSCNAVQPIEARFCSVCGTRMPEREAPAEAPAADAEYCPSCGSLRKNGAAFCDVCGKRFDDAEEAPAPAEPVITWPGEKPDTASTDEEPKEETRE